MNLFNFIQIILLQVPAIVTFGLIPMIVASYTMLNDKITFKVTAKRSLKSVNSIDQESILICN